MSNVSKRILARRAAVQILYQSEITGVPADKLVDEGLVPEEAKAICARIGVRRFRASRRARPRDWRKLAKLGHRPHARG